MQREYVHYYVCVTDTSLRGAVGLTIRDDRNFDWEGTVTDSAPTTYDKCEVCEL